MTTDIPHSAINALRFNTAKKLVIDLCINSKGPQLSFKKVAKQVGISELHIKQWVRFHQKTGFLGYVGQRQAALLCIHKQNPGIKFSEVIGLMKNMGFRCSTNVIKQHLQYLKPTLTNPYFVHGDKKTVLENIKKLTLSRRYKKKGRVRADRLTYDLSIMDHTYAEVSDSVSESSDEEKLSSHSNINRIIRNNVNINKILNTQETYEKHRKNKKVRNIEKRHFKISLIREQIIYLCIDDRGPKISTASAAKYLKSSEMLINKWISQAIQIKEYIIQKNKHCYCSKIQEVALRLFMLNPNLTQLQARCIMDHIKIHVSSTKLQQILRNLANLLNTSQFFKENKFDEIILDDEDLDYCINTLRSLIGWNNKNCKRVLGIKNDKYLVFKKIMASSLKHTLNNHSEKSAVLKNKIENIQGIKDNLDSQTNEIYFSPSYEEIQNKSSTLSNNTKDQINTKDLMMSVSNALSDKTINKKIKTEIALQIEICKKKQTYDIQPLYVKFAVVKEQVIYLNLNPHGPQIDLPTIASHLNQPKALLKTWINQALYIHHTVHHLHKQHNCGTTQEATIRVFKMNPALNEDEAVYVLNYTKISITRCRLKRYLEEIQYILNDFKWPVEILPEEESVNEISLNEKELNYCNDVIFSLYNTNKFEKHKVSSSISENFNSIPSDKLRLNNNKFSIKMQGKPMVCIPKQDIIDLESLNTINKKININEKMNVFNVILDSTDNKQIQNKESLKDNTKISKVDIVNFKKIENSTNQFSCNKTLIPESDNQMFTCVKYTEDLTNSVTNVLLDSTENKQIQNKESLKDNTKISKVDIVNFTKIEDSTNPFSCNKTLLPQSDNQMFTCVKYTEDLANSVTNVLLDSTENKQIQNKGSLKDNTKISKVDIVNFKKIEDSTNPFSCNKTLLPQSDNQMFTCVKYTEDLANSVTNVLLDKPFKHTKSKISENKICKFIQIYNVQPLHVKLAVVKEQVIYLNLNPYGPKIDLSTIASYLNKSEKILETWINQASYIQHTVQRLHKQHTCGNIQEATIRVFKMNPSLNKIEAVYVLNHTKVFITEYKLERYIDQTQYILNNFKWSVETLPKEASLNEIPFDEKDLNYCNYVLSPILDICMKENELDKYEILRSISANFKSIPSDELKLNSNELSKDIEDKLIDCVSNEKIVTDFNNLDTISEKTNINEKRDVFNSALGLSENEQFENEKLIKNNTKISDIDVINLRNVDKSSNRYLYDETLIPESIIQEETFTCDNRLDMIDESSGKEKINNHVGIKNTRLEDIYQIKTKIDSSKKTESNVHNLQPDIEIIEEKIKSISADYKRKKRKLSSNENETVTDIVRTEIIEDEDENCIIIKYY